MYLQFIRAHVEIHVHPENVSLVKFSIFLLLDVFRTLDWSMFPSNVESLCKSPRFPVTVQLGCLLRESSTVNLRRFFRDHARTPIKSKSPSGHCGWYLEQLPLRPTSSASTTSRGNPSCLEVLGLRAEFSNIIQSQQFVALRYLHEKLFTKFSALGGFLSHLRIQKLLRVKEMNLYDFFF